MSDTLIRLAALGCVALIATGQIVFKSAADAGVANGTFLALKPITIASIALAIYGIASVLWMLLLQHAPISRVYPFMGLAFVIVPVAAYFMFGEPLGVRYMLGSLLIAFGVVIAVSN